VTTPDGPVYRFAIDAFRKESLLRGLDAIGRTEQYNAAIDAYEARRRDEAPWLFVSG
jgi:3-isopropylmalate/(R)-2-methylmalate dehydratase small subunit